MGMLQVHRNWAKQPTSRGDSSAEMIALLPFIRGESWRSFHKSR